MNTHADHNSSKGDSVAPIDQSKRTSLPGLGSDKVLPSSTSVMGGGGAISSNVGEESSSHPYSYQSPGGVKQPLVYHQPNLIARLAPIKEDSYEKKVGPGSYDPIKPSMNLQAGGSNFGKSTEKRKLWFEGKVDEKLARA